MEKDWNAHIAHFVSYIVLGDGVTLLWLQKKGKKKKKSKLHNSHALIWAYNVHIYCVKDLIVNIKSCDGFWIYWTECQV